MYREAPIIDAEECEHGREIDIVLRGIRYTRYFFF